MANTLDSVITFSGVTSGSGTTEDFSFLGGTQLNKMYSYVRFRQGPQVGGAWSKGRNLKGSALTSASNLRIYSGVTPNSPTPFEASIVCWDAASDVLVARYAWVTNNWKTIAAVTNTSQAWDIDHGLIFPNNNVLEDRATTVNYLHATNQLRLAGSLIAGGTQYAEVVDWGNGDLWNHRVALGSYPLNYDTGRNITTLTDTLSIGTTYLVASGDVNCYSNRTQGQFYGHKTGANTLGVLGQVDAVSDKTRAFFAKYYHWGAGLVKVQQSVIRINDPALSAVGTITAVDLAKTFAVNGHTLGGGWWDMGYGPSSSPGGDGDLRDMSLIAKLTSPTEVTVTRGVAGPGGEYSQAVVQVWEWVGPAIIHTRPYYYRKMGMG